MLLKAFADELVQLGKPGLLKTARLFAPRPDHLVERMVATGALGSGALHGLQRAKAGLSKNPYDMPEGTAGGALARGAIGGLLAALGLKALSKLHGRGIRPR